MSTEDGLSSHNISCIVQDEIGYLWVGTDDGLNRYDGSGFQVYRNDPGDSCSLSDTRVTALLAVTYKRVPELWIGTRNGLNRLDLKTGIFTTYYHNPDFAESLSNPTVTSIASDENGAIWVGTENGLNLLLPENRAAGTFLKFLVGGSEFGSDRDSFIRKIITGISYGSKKELWVGTQDGLKKISYLDDGQNEISNYTIGNSELATNNNDIRSLFLLRQKVGVFLFVGTEAGGLFKLNALQAEAKAQKLWAFDNFIRDIQIDRFNRMWVATYGGGLFRFVWADNSLKQVTSFEGHPELKNSLSNSQTSDLFIDMSEVLWVATDNGLNSVLEPVHGFSVLSHRAGDPQSLISSGIRSIYEDSHGILWVGTVANGLTRVNRETGQYTHFIHDPTDSASLSTNSITTILEDRLGSLWLGTWEGGLLKLNADGETFTHFQHNPDDPNSIPNNIVQGLLEDRDGRLWLNTGNGLGRYDRKKNVFYNYLHQPDVSTSITAGELQSKAMVLDRYNRLWVGSYGGGINRLDLNNEANLNPETAQFDHFLHDIDNEQSISSDLVISLSGSQQENRDVVWVGTFNGGLTRIEFRFEGEVEHFTYKHYTEANGLSDNVIFGIEEDRRHDLWLSTGEGLSRFEPGTEHFTNYYVEDGLPANGFFWGASHRSASGEMFFGGTDGLVYFYPERILGRQVISPKISISGVQLMNKPLSLRPRDYNETELTFKYSQNLITIDWALFDFISSVKNRYYYRLEGLQNKWISAGNRTAATFSNLGGGVYTFRVKGFNYNGVESQQEATLQLIITPPFWQTNWFKVMVILSVIAAIYLLVMLRTKMIAIRNKDLREINEELNTLIKEKERAEEVTKHSLEEKEVLLREIYHRTKNNMSVIISLLNLQAANIDDPEITEMFDEIKGRIYAMSLVHEQLMRTKDLSVINLDSYVRQLVSNLIRSYQQVGNRVSCNIEIDCIEVSIDTAVPLGLVINEIITNSMKYAFPQERQGKINITAQLKGSQLVLRMSDDGVGFVQKHAYSNKKSLGARIIHTVVVDQLGGELKVESEQGVRYEILLRDVEIVRRV